MLQGKVALEEHVALEALAGVGPPSASADVNDPDYLADVRQRLGETSRRLDDMDRCGIQWMVLSLGNPGIQAIADPTRAIDTARRANDELAERFVRVHPDRFAGLAAVPMQDPAAAGDELERAVRDLGLKGALINGYSNTSLDDTETVQYLDEPPVWEFWARAAALDVPVYLHPRDPLPSQRRAYAGYPALIGSAWGFGVETASHVLRLMLSGLFDRFPGLKLIVGHLGEGLPFLLPRVEHRLRHVRPESRGAAQRPLTSYLTSNLWLTTSGTFRSAALLTTLLEVGSDRVLFSVDYPYERIDEQAEWLETVPLGQAERTKIGRTNALHLLCLEAA